MRLLKRTSAIVATALLLLTSLAFAASANHGVDCTTAPWPPRAAPDVLQLALAAEQEAAAGDPAAQWLLGSLYLFGLGIIPKDHDAGVRWIENAARTAIPGIRAATVPGTFSEMELFAIMLNTGQEQLPELVRQHGAAWGVAQYKHVARGILQVLSGCQ
jgi:TPR repeat protein